MIEWGLLCITDLFQNNSVVYFDPKEVLSHFFFEFFFVFMLVTFSVRTQEYFKRRFFLPIKSWINLPKKLHTYGSWEVFFSAAPTAKNSPELHFRYSFIQLSLLRSLVRMCLFKGLWLLFLPYVPGATCFPDSRVVIPVKNLTVKSLL